MKSVLIIMAFLLASQTAYGGFLGWGKKEPEEPKEPPKPEWCYASLQVASGVYYIYKTACGKITQVGVIDENERKIYTVDRLKISSGFEYYGDSKRLEYINTNWPGIIPIEFYTKPTQ